MKWRLYGLRCSLLQHNEYSLWKDEIDPPVVRLVQLPAHKKLSRIAHVVQTEWWQEVMVRDSKSTSCNLTRGFQDFDFQNDRHQVDMGRGCRDR